MILHNFDPKYHFGAVLERVTPQRYQKLPKPVLHSRVHGFGPDLRCDPLKNSSKIIFWIKVMQNHDFGALEMLLRCTRTNILWQECIWVGETIYTKIRHDFLNGWTRFAWSGPHTPWDVSTAHPSLDFRKFSNFLHLPSNQKYIYTWWIRKFLDVLKSYESESFISGVYDARGHDLPPLPRENVKRVSVKIQIGPPGRCAPPQ